ncbi:ribosome biogenesis protein NOP53-like [Trichogramma pretiosum]|uniref:ribosome biogenesis protein NOP53-like n=1 Tax=Trichogramma pretiosum TaxID=7493 RepID=UPI000C71A7F9|nr:ribosome biogenesis protein NOP53-like [Trichogramma pretiosum]
MSVLKVKPTLKKVRISKNKKKSWKKIDTQDIDSHLQESLLEERLGGSLSAKKDSELFFDDTKQEKISKKQYRDALIYSQPKCFSILTEYSSVSDPLVKRNRVRTPEERQKTLKKRLKKEVTLTQKIATHNRSLANEKRANRPKRGDVVNHDLWDVQPAEKIPQGEWLQNITVTHTLANTGRKLKRVPTSLLKKPSALPAVNVSHPGTSYNPAYKDHQDLLKKLADDERKLIKEEKHLNRVTHAIFKKVPVTDELEPFILDQDEGEEEEEEDTETENNEQIEKRSKERKKKTQAQRNRQKTEKQLRRQKLIEKLEKKKVADVYHLSQITNKLKKIEEKNKILKQKREEAKKTENLKTKVLSKKKFEPLEQEFQLSEELVGSLRSIQPVGNILKDRFKSLQQRNIVAPSSLVLKKDKAKIKKFVKADHKIDQKLINQAIGKKVK